MIMGRKQCARPARSFRATPRPPPRRSRCHRRCWCPDPPRRAESNCAPVAWCKIFAVSFISTMNVDSPRANESAAPMRVNIRSTMPILRFRRRHEAAHLGENHDQRHLAHVGRLAGHVRPGEQNDLLSTRLDACNRWATNAPRPTAFSTTGWRPSRIDKTVRCHRCAAE